jgi:hypothetical protein
MNFAGYAMTHVRTMLFILTVTPSLPGRFPGHYLKSFPSLFDLRSSLPVLKWKPTRPLIRPGLSTDPAIRASKQHAPEPNGRKRTTANASENKSGSASLCPEGVTVERDGCVV